MLNMGVPARRRLVCTARQVGSAPAFYERFYHGRVGERRNVAEVVRVAFGDLAQDTAHNLAGPCLGQ